MSCALVDAPTATTTTTTTATGSSRSRPSLQVILLFLACILVCFPPLALLGLFLLLLVAHLFFGSFVAPGQCSEDTDEDRRGERQSAQEEDSERDPVAMKHRSPLGTPALSDVDDELISVTSRTASVRSTLFPLLLRTVPGVAPSVSFFPTSVCMCVFCD